MNDNVPEVETELLLLLGTLRPTLPPIQIIQGSKAAPQGDQMVTCRDAGSKSRVSWY